MRKVGTDKYNMRFFDISVSATAVAVAVNTMLTIVGYFSDGVRNTPITYAVMTATLVLYGICFLLMLFVRGAYVKQCRKTEELQQLAEKNKNIYVNGLMHDIATPITRISGCASMISDGVVTDIGDIKKFASMIVQNTEDISIMLKNLSEIEKYNRAVINENLLPINLNTLLERYIRYLSLELAGKDVTISLINRCTVDPVCMIDVKSCKRVLMNLINNSVKYKKPDVPCKIEITLDTDDDGNVLFALADNGIGIEDGTQDMIFEMFYRGDGARHDVTDGNGVGLFVSAEIIKFFGGKIRADNNADGLTVFVTLPLTKAEAVEWFE